MARMHARLTGSDELEMGELDSFKHQASIFIHVQSMLEFFLILTLFQN